MPIWKLILDALVWYEIKVHFTTIKKNQIFVNTHQALPHFTACTFWSKEFEDIK